MEPNVCPVDLSDADNNLSNAICCPVGSACGLKLVSPAFGIRHQRRYTDSETECGWLLALLLTEQRKTSN